jgi:hypothetical protein
MLSLLCNNLYNVYNIDWTYCLLSYVMYIHSAIYILSFVLGVDVI